MPLQNEPKTHVKNYNSLTAETKVCCCVFT